MEDCLRHYVSPAQDDWDVFLPMVEFAINSAEQESTRHSPFFLNYYKHPRDPFTLQLPDTVQARYNAPAVDQLATQLHAALQRARCNLLAAQQRQKAYADRRRADVAVAVGDMVLLSAKNINVKHPGTRKLLPSWLGPFKVIAQINPVAFRLDLPASMSRVHPVFHAALLKPYRSDGTVQPPPPIVLDDSGADLAYIVETILDSREIRHGSRLRTQCLIKWAGYDHTHNTWEPASNILDPSLIADFESRTSAVQAARKPRLSRSKRR
jgi:hypothetical protein